MTDLLPPLTAAETAAYERLVTEMMANPYMMQKYRHPRDREAAARRYAQQKAEAGLFTHAD